MYLSHISITCCLVETTLACLASISFYMPHHYCIYRYTYIHTHAHTHTHTRARLHLYLYLCLYPHMNIYTISLARTMLKYVPPPSSASLATAVVAPMKLDNWPTNYMCIYILASVQSLVYTCIHILMCIYSYRVWKAGPPLDQIFALKYVSLSLLSLSPSLFLSFHLRVLQQI